MTYKINNIIRNKSRHYVAVQELDPEGRAAFLDALTILRTERDCTIIVTDYFWPQLQKYVGRVVVMEGD